jgi:hypothetical protein
MYLQLADQAPDILENYIFVPSDMDGGGKYVRADYFDQFDDVTFMDLMDQLQPYNEGVNGLFSKFKEKQAAKRAQRQERKDLKAESKATARVQRTQGGGALSKILNTATNIFGGTNVDAGVDFQTGQTPEAFFRAEQRTPWYSRPEIIIPVIGAAGLGIYFLTRKK